MTIEEVLKSMRYWEAKGNTEIGLWADAIEAAMREPVAYFWMGKYHCYEAHMADDLPCNTPEDKQPLYTLPPDQSAEIERLRDMERAYLDEVQVRLEAELENERLLALLEGGREIVADHLPAYTVWLDAVDAALAGKPRD